MVCVGILLSFHIVIRYTIPQYVISGLIMFVSAEVLEGNVFSQVQFPPLVCNDNCSNRIHQAYPLPSFSRNAWDETLRGVLWSNILLIWSDSIIIFSSLSCLFKNGTLSIYLPYRLTTKTRTTLMLLLDAEFYYWCTGIDCTRFLMFDARVCWSCARSFLPGVNLSLLSRVMSSRLSRGTYNGGLLSTEAGTIARVIADGTITLAGYLGDKWLLNATLLPSLCICVASIIATIYTYNSLY